MKKLPLTTLAILATAFFAASFTLAADNDIKVPPANPPKFAVPKTPEPRLTLEKERKGFAQLVTPKRIYKYHYYPDRQTYFDPDRNRWFYEVEGKWSSRESAPKNLDPRTTWSVLIEMGNDRPYERHDDVRKHYPRGRQSEGYREGFADGYEEGYRDAYDDGYRAAFDHAYREGYRVGYRDGDRSDDRGRHNPGEDKGRKEGWDKRENR